MAEHGEDIGTVAEGAPFKPSWMDRLIQRVDRLPGSPWLFYALIWIPIAFAVNVVLWIDGSVPLGSYGSLEILSPPLVFAWLAVYHYLTKAASRSLQSFRPLLDVDDSEFDQIDYRLATLPRQLGWLAIFLGLAVGIPFTVADPTILIDPAPRTALPYLVAVLAGVFAASTLFGFLFRTIRQLLSVRRLHAQATNINLLDLEPAHAFAMLTARTAISIILLLLLGTLFTSLDDPLENVSAVDIGLLAALVLFAVAIFVVPLLGMRALLQLEKKRKVSETTDLLLMTSDALESKVKSRDHAGLVELEAAINALVGQRERFQKISTWPWSAATIRGFVSTILIPIFLWLGEQLQGRFP